VSTPNNRIFDKFLSLIKDKSLSNLITDEEMTFLLNLFLNESSSIRFKTCKKNLKLIAKSDFYSQSFVANGVDKAYVIGKYPDDANSEAIEYFVNVEDFETPFVFDPITLTFTLTELPQDNVNIECGYNFIGQFNDDLNDEECWILAHGMIISWNSQYLNNMENLKNRLTTKDFNMFSPANLLKELGELRKNSLIEMRNLIVSYSFDSDFKGFN